MNGIPPSLSTGPAAYRNLLDASQKKELLRAIVVICLIAERRVRIDSFHDEIIELLNDMKGDMTGEYAYMLDPTEAAIIELAHQKKERDAMRVPDEQIAARVTESHGQNGRECASRRTVSLGGYSGFGRGWVM